MSPRDRQRPDRKRTPPQESAPAGGNPVRWLVLAIAIAGVLATAIWWRSRSSERSPGAADSIAASYVGSHTCASCHETEAAEWQHSQHARAMMAASEETVAGRFDGTQITHGGVTSTFFQRDGKYYVRTDGPDGSLADFEIAYTFGIEPLQQYLVELPGGRLQALSLAWDARPTDAGGQRWFHLYPNETIRAGDSLHWTGYLQNWNLMCADCHSTNLRKGYDAASRQFKTTWSEVSVGCESCHGPGSEHVNRARTGGAWADGSGLAAQLNERRDAHWTFDRAAGVPVRSERKTTSREVDVCARCHARRAQITDNWQAGDPFEDGFRTSLLEAPAYHADGQQRDEVYTYASFLQSRMYANGVTCSDCHNPHTGKLRLSGNATCTQCHQNPRYDSPEHHFHQVGTGAAACTACHMPTTTYMVVDPRHDHSFRVPRPDLTTSLGVPNPCTSCHTDRSAEWAAAQIQRHTGRTADAAAGFAAAFAAFDRGDSNASDDVWRIANDRELPAVVRGSALTRLARSTPHAWPLEAVLGDPDVLVRRTALQVLRSQDSDPRLRLARHLLGDPAKTVRIEAANVLADLADRALAGTDKDRFDRAFDELIAEQRFNGDRPEAHMNLGTAWVARGRIDDAVTAFREAVTLDPAFVPAYVNLAEAYRVQGLEPQAQEALHRAIQVSPSNAAVRHALGLSLVRLRRLPEAIVELERAVRLDPASARYAYVYAVALHDTGRAREAIGVLESSLRESPDDYDTLAALVLFNEQDGRLGDARRYVDRLRVLRPDDANVRAMADRLAAGQARD